MAEISVIICTYNRGKYLERAIDSCIAQSLDVSRFEINIIDNASRDDTKVIVEKYMKRYPHVRYFYESEQGLNKARTFGARVSRRQYIAYLDSDAYADKEWLNNLLDAFQTQEPRPVCVGGKIFLDWQGQRPAFYPHEWDPLQCFLDFGDRGFFLSKDNYLIGTNMAFKKDIILELGGFRTFFGRKGKGLISGAETEMINRILDLGLSVYYEPRAIVWHRVIPERKTRRFLIKRIYGDGATQSLLDLDKPAFRNVFLPRRILYDLKCSLIHFLKGLGLLIIDREKSVHYFLRGIQKLGRVNMELKFLYHPTFLSLWRGR